MNYTIFQGYALHGLLNYKKLNTINFKNFFDVYNNRMTNNIALDILKLSIELLESKNIGELKSKLQNVIFENGLEPPKISDIFDNTNDYYKDLYSKLKYFLFQYKTSNKICKIINIAFSRVLWLNFCKLLLLNLKVDDIAKNNIKIIFFLIVNLFCPDTNKNSLEFRNDAVSMLFSQCNFSSEILAYQEIYKIIDKDYSDYYPDLGKDNKFTQMFIEKENEKLINDAGIKKGDPEIKYIKKVCKELPFHFVKEYLEKIGEEQEINTLGSKKIYNFYRNCYNDLDDYSKKDFVEIIKGCKTKNYKEAEKIEEIINTKSFMEMVQNIMKSKVMKDAYNIIYRLYATDGKYDYNKEMTEEDQQINDSQSNLINGYPIKY